MGLLQAPTMMGLHGTLKGEIFSQKKDLVSNVCHILKGRKWGELLYKRMNEWYSPDVGQRVSPIFQIPTVILLQVTDRALLCLHLTR